MAIDSDEVFTYNVKVYVDKAVRCLDQNLPDQANRELKVIQKYITVRHEALGKKDIVAGIPEDVYSSATRQVCGG